MSSAEQQDQPVSLHDRYPDSNIVANPPKADEQLQLSIVNDQLVRLNNEVIVLGENEQFLLGALMIARQTSLDNRLSRKQAISPLEGELLGSNLGPKVSREHLFGKHMFTLLNTLNKDGEPPVVLREGEQSTTMYRLSPHVRLEDERFSALQSGSRKYIHQSRQRLAPEALSKEKPLKFMLSFPKEEAVKQYTEKEFAKFPPRIRVLFAYTEAVTKKVPHERLIDHLIKTLAIGVSPRDRLTRDRIIWHHNQCVNDDQYIKIDDVDNSISLLEPAKDELLRLKVIKADDLVLKESYAPRRKLSFAEKISETTELLYAVAAKLREKNKDTSAFEDLIQKHVGNEFMDYPLDKLDRLHGTLLKAVKQID